MKGRKKKQVPNSNRQLASELGISTAAVWSWRSGRSNPSLENVVKLAFSRGVSVKKALQIIANPQIRGKMEK